MTHLALAEFPVQCVCVNCIVCVAQERFVDGIVLMILTFNWSQNDTGVVIGDDVGVAVLGLVDLQVGVLPGELLSWIDGLEEEKKREELLKPLLYYRTH